jgi:uncharacterized protein YcfL
MKTLCVALISLLLAGCVATQRTIYVAPPLVEYSQEEQSQVADELERCAEACDQTHRLINDYGNLREAIRQTTSDPDD